MADSISFDASVKGFVTNVTEQLTLNEAVPFQIRLAAGATDIAVPFTGLSAPKLLIVKGGKGVTFKVGAETVVRNAYSLYAEIKVDGMSASTVLLSNADSIEHEVMVLVAE